MLDIENHSHCLLPRTSRPLTSGFHVACSNNATNMVSEELRPYDGCVLPPQASAIEELHDWSLNYNAGRNPYCVFLDLIGYAYDRWGCDAYIAPGISSPGGRYDGILGYKELCLISDALKVFENNGYDQVYEWCDALNEGD